jgi:hypothetical protein
MREIIVLCISFTMTLPYFINVASSFHFSNATHRHFQVNLGTSRSFGSSAVPWDGTALDVNSVSGT